MVNAIIEFAYGKVPLRAHREGRGAKVRVQRSGVLGIFSGCFAESVFQQVLLEIWEPKASQRERKGTVNNSKWSQNRTSTTQMEPKGYQKGASRRKYCIELAFKEGHYSSTRKHASGALGPERVEWLKGQIV